ncbi:hypothetical protein HQ590_10665 [bacterium]|nr:hypothetical protein [bacterium]
MATLCRELDLIHVVDPYRQQPALRQPRRYFRLHGIGGRQHQFSEEELRRLQQIVTADRSPVWCLFNNAAMATDAQRFQRLAAPRSPASPLAR